MRVLGPRFIEVEPYLRPCPGKAAQQIPCPTTGITLSVKEANGQYVCFPTGEEAEDTPDLYLSWEHIQAWRLDMDSAKAMVQNPTPVSRSHKHKAPSVPHRPEYGTEVRIIGDFKVIRIPGHEEINLGTRYRARAVLRFIHKQVKLKGTADFYIEEMRDEFNTHFSGKQWKSDRIREDLFRGKEHEFDLLFETLDKASGYYRMKI